ncbi:MAG: LysR family transcriptional regulator [Pseudomonadota bacterium]
MKNISAVDLNLLVAFQAMLEERSVTRAANRIGLAQPSMSNALARLRALFDDELFVRTPQGMVPTRLALDAADHVKAAVAAADSAFNVGEVFSPKTATGTFRILTHDLIEITVLPDLLRTVEKDAPNIHVGVRSLVGESFEEDLDFGRADIAVCAAAAVPKRFSYQVVFRESFVCLARLGHPIVRGNELNLETYLACKHATMSRQPEGKAIVDEALAGMGRSREISASVANFGSLPPLVIETDLIAVIPLRLAKKACHVMPLVMFELPFDLPSIEVKLIWNRSVDRSPMSVWFRDLMVKTVSA